MTSDNLGTSVPVISRAEGPGDIGPNRFDTVNERLPDVDVRSLVVVPARPGLPVSLQALERGHGTIDDAVLRGAVMPIRSRWWRFGSARRSARLGALLGDGVLLRIDDSGIQDLVGAHQRLMAASAALAPGPQARVQQVTHSALLEVASLFGRHVPVTQVDRIYVADRLRALQQLDAALADPRVADGESERWNARIEARHDIEQIAGNSITEVAALCRELLGDDPS